MNALNRFALLVFALVLTAVPVALLLVAFGVFPADQIDSYTGYRAGLASLESVSGVSALEGPAKTIAGIASIAIAVASLLFLLRELTFGRMGAKAATIEDGPGKEVKVSAKALKSLAEGAAREEGALSPSCRLESNSRAYTVACRIALSPKDNATEQALRVKERVRSVLEGQKVELKDVEVTVTDTAS